MARSSFASVIRRGSIVGPSSIRKRANSPVARRLVGVITVKNGWAVQSFGYSLALVRRHEQQPVEHVDLFCDWLAVTPGSLQFLMDRQRNPTYWNQPAPGKWEFRGWSTWLPQEAVSKTPSTCTFMANAELDSRPKPRHIVVGKGHS